MRRLEELMKTLIQENRALREEMGKGFKTLREELIRINRNIGGIMNTLGVSPQGIGREALLEYLWDRGEKVKQIWESTGRKVARPDVVVKTDRGVYILEAKHRIEGEKGARKVIEQLRRGEELIRKGKIGNLKVKKGEPVVWAVYAFVISPAALQVLETESVLVLYEGKEALARGEA